MPSEKTRGQRLDLYLVKGKTFERYFVSNGVSLEDGAEVKTPIDFSVGTLRAQARRKIGDTSPAITFTVSANLLVPGGWRLFASALTLASSTLVSGLDETDPRAFYERWDAEYEYPDGSVVELYWGELYLLNEATR